MTGGFLSVPNMRPNCGWTYLHGSFLAALLLVANTDSEACGSEIKVRRNTSYEILVGQDLVINCTLVFCSSPPPAVLWLKTRVPVDVSNQSHIKTEWKLIKELEGMSYLIFQQIRSNDSGLYQCQSAGNVGHTINVSVHGGGGELTNVTWRNNTDNTGIPNTSPVMWMYMYSAAGIVVVVVLVIIASLSISMRGCKGKARKEAQSETQYAAVPMVEELPPRQSPSGQSNVSTPQRHNKCVYGEVKQKRERPRTAAEDGGSVVYAALNHRLPPGAAPRPQRNQEESSVYAAIRVP